MAYDHSYIITRKNNITEKQGIRYILEQDSRFIEIDLKSKREVMEALGVNQKYARSFDLIMLDNIPDPDNEMVLENFNNITLIELKTTQKRLENFPSGFFFGATENEFQLARQLGDKYKFCFISLDSELRQYILLSYQELEERIRTKRIQFQINLK